MASKGATVEGLLLDSMKPVRVWMESGKIQKVEPLDDRTVTPMATATESLPFLAPGLVDLQVNGYGGFDINHPNLSRDTVKRFAESLWAIGVTQCLPTLITNDPDQIERSLLVIRSVIESDARMARMLVGIHVEGPFLSAEDGPRGAHDKRFIIPPDWALFERWQTAAGGRIRLVTLSPEYTEASDFVRRCTALGVKVAIGHTAATGAQIREAVDSGASLSTHLGNGAHPVLKRHPNYLWDQLAEDDLWASFIGDGFHLPDSVVKVILRVKGEHAFLVSDTVTLAGMAPGRYRTEVGGHVELDTSGRLCLCEHPEILAGSVMPLVGAVEQVVRRQGLSMADGWDLASIRPATWLGLDTKRGLEVGAPANLVLFTVDRERIRLQATYLGGERVFA